AAAALDPAVTQSPASRMTAVPANESARPAQPLKVVQAVVVSAEPGKELAGRSRVVRARDWCRHATSLVRLSGYPRRRIDQSIVFLRDGGCDRCHGVGCRVAVSVPGLGVVPASMDWRGMRTARTRPMSAITRSIVSATAKGLPSGSLTATRAEPTRAVPREDPRLETLRDRPEISPWSVSGKLDWTTLTEAVSMSPI